MSDSDSDSDYAEFSSDEEGAGAVAQELEPAEPPALSRQTSGQLDPSDVVAMMQLKVDYVHNILSVPKEECQLFLEHLRWDDELVQAKLLDSEQELRKAAGVTRGACPPTPPAGEDCLEECPYTLDDDVPWTDADALPCGHWMSKEGWREYMSESADTGPAMVLARCFSSGCNERVRQRMFKEYLQPEQYRRYTEYSLAAFVQGDRQLVQCTGADCDQVMHIKSLQAHDLECSKCHAVFCSSCGAEGHQPATCSQLRAWVKKNTDEGENITWIHANTKPCPKCHVNIEKNQGCNHMTCRKNTGGCGHQFCWLCLGNWNTHSKCEPPKNLLETQQQAARTLDRFMRQYTPYHNHDTARKHAKKLKAKLRRQHVELVENKSVPLRDADVLLRAVDAVLSGRRVLMHTHVFAYFCEDKSELALFEHMQEQLNINNERVLERLELRDDVEQYLNMPQPEQKRVELYAYITELRNYTELSLKFMREMLNAVQGGLLEDPGDTSAAAAAAGAASADEQKWGISQVVGPAARRRRAKEKAQAQATAAALAASGAAAAAADAERETHLAQLMSLGHDRQSAEAALRATYGNLAAAEELLS